MHLLKQKDRKQRPKTSDKRDFNLVQWNKVVPLDDNMVVSTTDAWMQVSHKVWSTRRYESMPYHMTRPHPERSESQNNETAHTVVWVQQPPLLAKRFWIVTQPLNSSHPFWNSNLVLFWKSKENLKRTEKSWLSSSKKHVWLITFAAERPWTYSGLPTFMSAPSVVGTSS